MSYVQECIARGERIRVISRRLGMVEKTLRRWLPILEAEEATEGFQEVSIVETPKFLPIPMSGSIRIVTPQGYVVEGLDEVSLVSVLKELG